MKFYEHKLFAGDDVDAIEKLHAQMFPNGLTAPFDFQAADIGATMNKAMDCNLYFPAIDTAFESMPIWSKVMHASADPDRLTELNEEIPSALQERDQLFSQQFGELATSQKENLWGIYGDADGLIGKKQLGQIKAIIDPTRFTLLKGASHFAFMDDEDAFLKALLADLAAMK